MTNKPTQEAEWAFNRTGNFYGGSPENVQLSHLAIMLQEMSKGLANLSIGLRATYNLLDEVNRKLNQQGGFRPPPR
jgi:hypothetical protein